MSQGEKYKKLTRILQSDVYDSPETLPQSPATYYFKQIQRLSVDSLLTQLDINEQEKQVAALEEKIQLHKDQNKFTEIENRKSNQNSSEQAAKEYVCLRKDCHKKYQRESGLKLHQMITHQNPPVKWRQNSIFHIFIASHSQQTDN